MRYYYPDYFKDFVCIGGKACSDSCCHIWQITVDKKTLRKYKHVTGELGKRMAEKIDQKTNHILTKIFIYVHTVRKTDANF